VKKTSKFGESVQRGADSQSEMGCM